MLLRSCIRHCTVEPAFAPTGPTCKPTRVLRRANYRSYVSTQHTRDNRLVGPRAPIQSSLTSTVFAASAACIAVGGSLLLYNHYATIPVDVETPDTKASAITTEAWSMVGVQNGPGRPGNLTVEQEVKLQELWKATLKVFGVPLDDVPVSDAINDAIEGDDEVDEADDGKDEKRKKKRGIFGRKKKDGKDSKSDEARASMDASDDKYGQAKEFHKALETNSAEDLRTAFWSMVKHDHPDGLLLRFLRARKWDVEKALIMMISTMHWRLKDMHVDDDVVFNGEGQAAKDAASSDGAIKKEGNDFMTQLRMGKSFLHGSDKEGRPICVVRARLHRQGEQSEQSLERFTVHIIETCRLLLAPPVDTATIIFDMTGFSLANMDYTPVKFMIKVFEANYPESLGVVLVHNAPWLFQGVWKVIRGWLDPVVAGKVHFTNNVNDLSVYVEPSHIIKQLGGEEPWEYKYIEPVEGENAAMADTATRDRLQASRQSEVKEFEAATKEWLRGAPSDKASHDKRNAVADKLKAGYWQLDPYVRARSLCDRTGVITKDGSILFYPNEAKQAVASAGPTAVGHADDLD